jgi:hypothetical protein
LLTLAPFSSEIVLAGANLARKKEHFGGPQ